MVQCWSARGIQFDVAEMASRMASAASGSQAPENLLNRSILIDVTKIAAGASGIPVGASGMVVGMVNPLAHFEGVDTLPGHHWILAGESEFAARHPSSIS